MDNPYRDAGRVAVGTRFLGRGALVRQVAEVWHAPGRPTNLRIVGYHRTGKTSAVRRALDTLPPRDDIIPVRLNIGSQGSGMDLYRSIVRRVLEAAREPSLTAVASVIMAADQWYDLLEGVEVFFKQVRGLGLNVLVVLDEFDRAASAFTQLAEFQLLRNLVSEPDFSIGLITVSRRDLDRIEIAAASGSTLSEVISTVRYVGMFDNDEVDLLLGRSAQAGLVLASVRDEIMARAGAHPFLLESLCKRIVEVHEQTGKVNVAEAFTQESALFEMQFGRLLDAVNTDTDGKGGMILQELALGSVPVVVSPELGRLRRTGIVTGDTLFSAEFAHYLTRKAILRLSPERCYRVCDGCLTERKRGLDAVGLGEPAHAPEPSGELLDRGRVGRGGGGHQHVVGCLVLAERLQPPVHGRVQQIWPVFDGRRVQALLVRTGLDGPRDAGHRHALVGHPGRVVVDGNQPAARVDHRRPGRSLHGVRLVPDARPGRVGDGADRGGDHQRRTERVLENEQHVGLGELIVVRVQLIVAAPSGIGQRVREPEHGEVEPVRRCLPVQVLLRGGLGGLGVAGQASGQERRDFHRKPGLGRARPWARPEVEDSDQVLDRRRQALRVQHVRGGEQ